MSERALLYIPSAQIVGFVTRNPIDWSKREWSELHGPGDMAGKTPTPAVEEFLNLLIQKRGLFTQKEYMQHCWDAWDTWIRPKPSIQKYGVKAKLYRNFYPSMVDSIHVWAMLCETGMFDLCFMSATEDAIGKSDLILHSDGRELRLALLGPTDKALRDREYKIRHRDNGDAGCIEIRLPIEYPRSPGNKRWFRKSDIMEAIGAQQASNE